MENNIYLYQLRDLLKYYDDNLNYHKGFLLELITCLEYNNFILNKDVDNNYKLKYGISKYDDGIDLFDINNNIIAQVKNYKPNTYITEKILGTFYGYVIQLYNTFKFHIYTSENIKIKKKDKIEYYEINNNIINKWIDKTKELKDNNNNEFKIRYYQEDVLKLMSNTNKLINYYQLCCGSGKSYIIFEFIKSNLDKKHLILVPNIILAEQFQYKLNNEYKIFNINYCYTNTNKNFNDKFNIYICVYNSFHTYIKPIINTFDYVYIDEAHHIKEENYIINNESIYDILNNSNCKKYYFSATLRKINKELDYQYNIYDGVKDNIIMDFNINIHLLNKITNENIIKQIKLYPEYQKILIYCSTIQKILDLTKLFNENNIKSICIHNKININDRINIIKDFEEGKYRVLFSVNTLSEGIDIKTSDTCIFLDDKNSEISIIQCLGRMMRKSNNKSKCQFVIFTEDNEDFQYNKYLNVINKYTNYFENDNNINNKIHLKIERKENNNNDKNEEYNEEQYEKLKEFERKIYYDVIKNLKLNDEMKIKLCQEFYDKNKRLPINGEIFNNWKIRSFIIGLKIGQNKHLKNKIEEIFKIEIKINKLLSDEDKLNLCQEFYNKNKRLPKKNEIYKEWKIGNFIAMLKQNHNNHLKDKIEEIFQCKLINKTKHITDEDKIKLCKEFYEEKKRLPKISDIYKDWQIGQFIYDVKRNKNNLHLKKELQKIFNDNLEVKIKRNKILTNEEKIQKYKIFYEDKKRLPTKKDIKYFNDFNIYKDFNRLKDKELNKNQIQLKDELEKIFNCKIENTKNRKLLTIEEKINICKDYVKEYGEGITFNKNTIYKDLNIFNFIHHLQYSDNHNIRNQIEKIFNIEIKDKSKK